MSKFDARQHLIAIRGLGELQPKLLFEGEILDYPGNPRMSVIAGFPDACTYGLGQEAKWAQTKTTMKTYLKETQENLEEEKEDLEEVEEEVEEEVKVAEQKFQKEPTREAVRRLSTAQTKLEEVRTKTQVIKTKTKEVQQEKKHIEKRGKIQATVFGIGNTIHNQVRIKTREELLGERKIFLVNDKDVNDWFHIEEKLSQGYTIVGQEFPVYIVYKGLIITGHPDNFILPPNLVLDLEEWKTSKTGERDPKHDIQANLYSLALKEIFGPKEQTCTIRVWNKSTYPLEGKRLLTRLKTRETTVPINPSMSYTIPLNGRSKEIDTILDYTYNLFTAQIPCTPVGSGLCKNWCPIRYKCPEFREMRQFVNNFKVEVPNGN